MILSGRPVALALEDEIKIEIIELAEIYIKPFLAVILVGDDPASILYTRKKQEKAESLGIGFRLYKYPSSFSQENLITIINDLNMNKSVHGIIIQLPLPESFDTTAVLSTIEKTKDVDGLNNGFPPTTAGAILEILNYYNIDFTNKKVVLVGHGKLVGEPLGKILSQKNIDLTVCDSKTENLAAITLAADVIISGVGKPGLITPLMVKSDAIIIDAGTAESNGSTLGDVDTEVYNKVASYSPVPGGVGPVTVVKLLKNVVEAAKK